MSKNEPIVGFGIAENVAQFLLQQAFYYVNEAAQIEVASELFGQRIENISPDLSWQVPEIPEKLEDWLKSKDQITDNILDPITLKKLSKAWYSSLDDAYKSNIKIRKIKQLQSTENIVGHVINLTVCLEASLNRHLYFLRESNQLEPFHYNCVDRSELMPKLMFCFKEQIINKDIDISRIKQLVSFRNKSIHYRIDTPEFLQVSTEDLISIWNQVGNIFALIDGEPTELHIEELIKDFTERWIS